MKIAPAQHIAVLWKNKRIIGNGSQFAFKDVGTVFQGIAYRAEDLGCAAHCIRILHPGAVLMAGVDLALTYQFSQSGGTDALPILAPPLVNARIQGHVTAHQTLDTHGACNFCRSQERLGLSELEYRNCLSL